jgi:hypothetical protein
MILHRGPEIASDAAASQIAIRKTGLQKQHQQES